MSSHNKLQHFWISAILCKMLFMETKIPSFWKLLLHFRNEITSTFHHKQPFLPLWQCIFIITILWINNWFNSVALQTDITNDITLHMIFCWTWWYWHKFTTFEQIDSGIMLLTRTHNQWMIYLYSRLLTQTEIQPTNICKHL